jgi:hypothetical protein
MTLAAVLAVCSIGFGWTQPSVRHSNARDTKGAVAVFDLPRIATVAQGAAPASSSSTPPSANSPQTPPTSKGTPQNSTDQTKPPHKVQRHHKKISSPNCATASTPANAEGAGPGGTGKDTTASLPPCPPPKKVVRDGGSDEPAVQLTGGTPAEQASHQRSTTEQITAATEGNLKKVSERQLTSGQQEIVDQIHEFMEQSKAAVAAGDLERAHKLALKAHLLSDELVKPE